MLGEGRRSFSWPAAFMAMVTLILVLGACGGSKEPPVAADTTIGSVSTERGSDPIVQDATALREASDNEQATQALRDLHPAETSVQPRRSQGLCDPSDGSAPARRDVREGS